MTLSKVSFSEILRNDYLDHFDTFGENFDFDSFKNDTFENDTFETVWVDRHSRKWAIIVLYSKNGKNNCATKE